MEDADRKVCCKHKRSVIHFYCFLCPSLTGLETGGRYSGLRYWLAEVSMLLLSLLLHIEDHGVKVSRCVLMMMITDAIASCLGCGWDFEV